MSWSSQTAYRRPNANRASQLCSAVKEEKEEEEATEVLMDESQGHNISHLDFLVMMIMSDISYVF